MSCGPRWPARSHRSRGHGRSMWCRSCRRPAAARSCGDCCVTSPRAVNSATPRRCWIPACSRRSGPASSGAASPQVPIPIGTKPEPGRFRLDDVADTAFSQQNGGYSVDCSFGTYMLVNAAYAPRIPDGVDPLEIAPILCAGVTVYKGLKVTDTRPGQWVAISGIGGLGHIAVQYARAMGLRVVAIDVDDSKLALATRLGAEVVVNARTSDVVAEVQKATGGVHGVLVTAVHPQAFGQAIGLARRGGTIVFNGLPPGDFPAPIFDIVLKGLTIRGSIVGTRQDMAEALDFYARGLIHPTVASAGLDEINDVFERMERGQIDGRVVIDYRKS